MNKYQIEGTDVNISSNGLIVMQEGSIKAKENLTITASTQEGELRLIKS